MLQFKCSKGQFIYRHYSNRMVENQIWLLLD